MNPRARQEAMDHGGCSRKGRTAGDQIVYEQ
jgi:hypothetical protein